MNRALLFRRVLQLGTLAIIGYTALGGPWRNYKRAHNLERIVSLIHGDIVGFAYGLNEDILAIGGDAYETSKAFLGMPWTMRIFGIDFADPVLGLSYFAMGGSFAPNILWSLVPVVLLAVFGGRFFCSHLCPMRLLFEVGQAFRRGLMRLGMELPTLNAAPGARYGGYLLVGGVGAALFSSMAVWFLVLPHLSLALGIFVLASTGTLTWALISAGFWLFVDVSLAPGYFCHSLCPTGYVLGVLGRFSFWRLSKAEEGAPPCPTSCQQCSDACPYGLNPSQGTHEPACDRCGVCVPACPQQKLSRRLRRPSLAIIGSGVFLLFGVLWPATGFAHHNKGLPHYGYYENYPQVPTEEAVVIQGRWELGATVFNFQGMQRQKSDTPDDLKIYAYIYDLERDIGYLGPVRFELRLNGALVSTFSREGVDEESIYSTRETVPESGMYELVAFFGRPGVEYGAVELTLPFYVDLNDGPNMLTIVLLLLPAIGLFAIALLGRKKSKRRRRQAHAGVACFFLLTGASAIANANPAPQSISAATDGDRHALGPICPHCGMRDCTMQHLDAGDGSGATVMVMRGIPSSYFLGGFACIILLSFVIVEWLGKRRKASTWRFNIIGQKWVYRFARSRWLQPASQLVSVGILIFLIYAGLSGSRVVNIAPVAVWTVWWGLLIFMVLLLGASWCHVCPWDGLANIVSRMTLSGRRTSLSLNLGFPVWLASVYPAIGLFVLLTWLELGYGVTSDPRLTAYMGLGMAVMAVSSALLWQGKKFCAHLCPIGRICGTYGTFAPIEVRGKRAATCANCRTEDCLHGNEKGYPCPVGLSLKTIDTVGESACTLCSECIKSCNKHNVAINLRPFAAGLRQGRVPRLDEAFMALILLALTLFHGLSMTPAWENFEPGGMSLLKWLSTTLHTPRLLNFTGAMLLVCAVPVLLYWLSVRLAAWLGDGEVPWRQLFRAYAYSLLPVALFYHLAHNAMHVSMEGGGIVPLLSDPLGSGSDIFGTADVHVGPLIGGELLWLLQILLILVGHVFGIVVAHSVGHRLYRDAKRATRSLIPIPLMMVLISVAGLYLMHMDMNMRSGRM